MKTRPRREPDQWTEFAAQLVDKITGKDVMVTYEFDDFEIKYAKTVGPNGQDLGSASGKYLERS